MSRGENNQNNHIIGLNRQTYNQGSTRSREFLGPASFRRAGSSKAIRIAVPHKLAQPLLVGDRQTLRALRAAEMAAWESVKPSTRETPNREESKPITRFRVLPEHSRIEGWFFVAVAGCATVAVVAGFSDLSKLLAGWSRFVEGIRLLID
jgi:hypothetical protein